jgi:hypothetical protein
MLVNLLCADASTCAVGIGRYVCGLVCMCGVDERKWLRVGTSAYIRGERLTGVMHDVKPVSDDPPPLGVLQLPIGDCNHNSIAPPFAFFWGPLGMPLHLCSAAPAEVRERRRKRVMEKGQWSHSGISVLPETMQVGRGPHARAGVCAHVRQKRRRRRGPSSLN